MKRLILLIVFVLGSLIGNAQFYMHAVTAQVGYWSYVEDNWNWDSPTYSDVQFTLTGRLIQTNDKAGSYYITGELISDTEITSIWKARDEKNRSCQVMLTIIDGYNYLIIIYSDTCFRYQTKND